MRTCLLWLPLAACSPELADPAHPEPDDTSYATGNIWRSIPERCGQDTDRTALIEYGTVTFVNLWSGPVEVVLVDDRCLEYPTVQLDPEQQEDLGAYIGWIFRVYDEQMLLSSWYMPTPGEGTVVVQP